MRVTIYTRQVLSFRREAKLLKAQGYRCHETDWEIVRGDKTDMVIIDAKVSVCGKFVWTKIGNPK